MDLLEPDFRVHFVPPPYTAPEPVGVGLAPEGSLLLLDCGDHLPDLAFLSSLVPTLRARSPATPVILQVDHPSSEILHHSIAISEFKVRAIVTKQDCSNLAAVLRPTLTRPDYLGKDVVEWLSLVELVLSPILNVAFERLFGEIVEHATIGEALSAWKLSPTAFRRDLTARKLPSARRWWQLARALRSALAIQRTPDKDLLSHALELGYADHSSLSRQLLLVFGVRPGAISGTLGWEWLLVRWLDKKNMSARGSQ